jgi:branched-chain amino acid transport system ATP-binding protein
MAAEPVLELRGVSVAYGGVLACEEISLVVPTGGAVCLLGPNGAGKTTVLRAISGILGFHGGRITSGSVRFRGRDVTGMPADRLVREGICQVLERRHVFSDLTVAENLRSGAFVTRDRRRAAARQEMVLELFPVLHDRMGQAAGLLSGGEQQMLAIGRALMGEPALLLLDEPSLGLAPLVITAIGRALREARTRAGLSILLVEQSSAMAGALTEHGYLLESGQVRADGPTAALLADDTVRSVYLGASV